MGRTGPGRGRFQLTAPKSISPKTLSHEQRMYFSLILPDYHTFIKYLYENSMDILLYIIELKKRNKKYKLNTKYHDAHMLYFY